MISRITFRGTKVYKEQRQGKMFNLYTVDFHKDPPLTCIVLGKPQFFFNGSATKRGGG